MNGKFSRTQVAQWIIGETVSGGLPDSHKVYFISIYGRSRFILVASAGPAEKPLCQLSMQGQRKQGQIDWLHPRVRLPRTLAKGVASIQVLHGQA